MIQTLSPRHRVVLILRYYEDLKITEIAEIVKAHEPIEGEVTVYLCEDFVCKSPMTEYDAFLIAIKELQ